MNIINIKDYLKQKNHKNNNYDLYYIKKFNDLYVYIYYSKINKVDLNNINNILKNKDIILGVNIPDVDIKYYNPFIIEKYKFLDKNMLLEKEKEYEYITLLDSNCLTNLSVKDINNGKLFTLDKYKDIYELNLFDIVSSKESVNCIINRLKNKDFLSDIYFYTEDNDLLNKYSNKIILKRIKSNKFKIYDKKLIVIDSLTYDKIRTLNYGTYSLLLNLCNDSIPVNIIRDNDIYKVVNYSNIDNAKKGYILCDEIESIIHYSNIDNLLGYINIYCISGDNAKKISLLEYCKEKNILKYIKKPN